MHRPRRLAPSAPRALRTLTKASRSPLTACRTLRIPTMSWTGSVPAITWAMKAALTQPAARISLLIISCSLTSMVEMTLLKRFRGRWTPSAPLFVLIPRPPSVPPSSALAATTPRTSARVASCLMTTRRQPAIAPVSSVCVHVCHVPGGGGKRRHLDD